MPERGAGRVEDHHHSVRLERVEDAAEREDETVDRARHLAVARRERAIGEREVRAVRERGPVDATSSRRGGPDHPFGPLSGVRRVAASFFSSSSRFGTRISRALLPVNGPTMPVSPSCPRAARRARSPP